VAGYTPIFDSVFQGSLCGKYPDLPVWLVLLALQQRGGIIDAHPSYIAMISGIPQEDIEAAIERFCQPDPRSRTPDYDGRRLEPLEGAGFGWRVLNHRKYQEKARLEAKNAKAVAEGKEAERKRVTRDCPPQSAAIRRNPPLSDPSNSNSNSNLEETKKRATALPSDFGLSDDRKIYAESKLQNVDAVELLAAFRDYHTKEGTTSKDWDASWRTYVRNGIKFGYPVLKVNGRPVKQAPTPEQITQAQREAAEANKRQLTKALGPDALKGMP
jgi:hypothetical protein